MRSATIPTSPRPHGAADPAKAFKGTVNWITALRKAGRTDVRPSISEFGVSRSALGFTPAVRVKFLIDAVAYLKKRDPRSLLPTGWLQHQ